MVVRGMSGTDVGVVAAMHRGGGHDFIGDGRAQLFVACAELMLVPSRRLLARSRLSWRERSRHARAWLWWADWTGARRGDGEREVEARTGGQAVAWG